MTIERVQRISMLADQYLNEALEAGEILTEALTDWAVDKARREIDVAQSHARNDAARDTAKQNRASWKARQKTAPCVASFVRGGRTSPK